MKKIFLLLLTISIFHQLLSSQCPPSPVSLGCDFVVPICEGIDGYCNTLVPQTQITEPFPGCAGTAVINNDDWIAFYAGTSTISIQIIPTNCEGNGGNMGIQAGLYAACDPDGGVNGDGLASEYLALQCGCTTSPINWSYSNFVVGQVYYIVIDGCGGDICDYEIVVLQGNTISEEIIEQTGNIQGDSSFCSGEIATFNIEPVENATYYNWSADSTANILSGQGTTEVEVLIATEGSIDICVTSENGCFTGTESCISVSSMGMVYSDTIVESLCEGDSIEFEGESFSESGFYTFTYTNVEGCDSILNLNLSAYETFEANIDTILCEGMTFEIGDTTFSESVEYTAIFSTVEGCDSTINLNLSFADVFETNIDTSFESGGLYNGISYESDTSFVENYTATNGCDSLVTINIMTKPVGVSLPAGINQLSIFPNPANNQLYLQIDLSEAIELNLDCYNTLGKKLNNLALHAQYLEGKHNIELDVSQLAIGTYFPHFQTEKGNMTKRLVISR